MHECQVSPMHKSQLHLWVTTLIAKIPTSDKTFALNRYFALKVIIALIALIPYSDNKCALNRYLSLKVGK